MKSTLLLATALGLAITSITVSGHAQEDNAGHIEARKALMQANGAAAGISGAMMKGDLDYHPALGKAAIATFRAVSLSFGSHFPEGSSGEGTRASPAIWENPEGFAAALDKLKQHTATAVEASGKDGPADLQAFQAAAGPILQDCRACHTDFRLSD